MPLGVTYSSTAADLISGGGKALADNIRNIGKEISAITERRRVNQQVEALGKELSALDPNSADYMQKLTGIAGRYPDAVQSPAGMKLLAVGVEANRGWQREQLLQDKLSGASDVARIRGETALALERERGENKLAQIDAQTDGRIREAEKRGASAKEVAEIRADGELRKAQMRESRPIIAKPGDTVLDSSGIPLFSAPEKQMPDRSTPTGNARLQSLDKERQSAVAEILKLEGIYHKITGDDSQAGTQRASIGKRVEELSNKIKEIDTAKQSLLNPVPERMVPVVQMLPEPVQSSVPQGTVPNSPWNSVGFVGPMMPEVTKKTRVIERPDGSAYEVDDDTKTVIRALR